MFSEKSNPKGIRSIISSQDLTDFKTCTKTFFMRHLRDVPGSVEL